MQGDIRIRKARDSRYLRKTEPGVMKTEINTDRGIKTVLVLLFLPVLIPTINSRLLRSEGFFCLLQGCFSNTEAKCDETTAYREFYEYNFKHLFKHILT